MIQVELLQQHGRYDAVVSHMKAKLIIH